ncbi:PQQ-binding-like beta-propeller repeat protein [Streptomyces sp. NPDC059525]|uniref:outer membrane protein assembly factor BamB family protein n=1 Tax=Streptomyces sp. NPDC059525 TaxID=3346857 RepID=UPI00368D0DE4
MRGGRAPGRRFGARRPGGTGASHRRRAAVGLPGLHTRRHPRRRRRLHDRNTRTAAGGPYPCTGWRTLRDPGRSAPAWRQLRRTDPLGWLTTGRPLLMALSSCRTSPTAERGRHGEEIVPPSVLPAPFMAPETVGGRVSSQAADIYALGVLLAHATTGRYPFGEGPPEVLAYRASHGKAELHGLPADLAEAVAAALAAVPGDRPTAAELSRSSALRRATSVADSPAPGKVIIALAALAQETADLGGDADRDLSRRTDVATRPLHRAADGPTSSSATARSSPAGPLTRRALLSRLATGAAGAVLGAGTALTWTATREPAHRSLPDRPLATARVPGLPPAALWRFDDVTARTTLLRVTGAGRYLVTRGETLHAHEIRSGKEVWERPVTFGRANPVLLVGEGRILVQTHDALVLCSLDDGRTHWIDRTLHTQNTTVLELLAVGGDTVWLHLGPAAGASATTHALAAFDLAARKELWRSELPADFVYELSLTPTPAGLLVEVLPEVDPHRDPYGTRKVPLACFDRATGRSLWQRTYEGVYSGPASAVDETGRFYVLSTGRARAYDATSGNQLWESTLRFDGQHSPLLLAGTLLCETDPVNGVVALDRDTGRKVWQQRLDEPLQWFLLGTMATSASGRTLFVPTRRQLAALDLRSGDRLWQLAFVGREDPSPLQLLATPDVLIVAQPSVVFALPAV